MRSLSRANIFATLAGFLLVLSGRRCAGFSVRNGADRVAAAADRREALRIVAAGAAGALTTTPPSAPARALDFDAFESGVISKDADRAAPKLSDDEALCKYGAPGKVSNLLDTSIHFLK